MKGKRFYIVQSNLIDEGFRKYAHKGGGSQSPWHLKGHAPTAEQVAEAIANCRHFPVTAKGKAEAQKVADDLTNAAANVIQGHRFEVALIENN